LLIIGFIVFVIFSAPGVSNDFDQAVEAAGGCPYQEGARMTGIQCIVDPPPTPWTCNVTCPKVTNVLVASCLGEIASANVCISTNGIPSCTSLINTAVQCVGCAKYQEFTLTDQQNIAQNPLGFIGIPITFNNFLGGGSRANILTPGLPVLYCNKDNIGNPYAIGIPGATALKVKNFFGLFDYIIAGFKN